MQPQRKEEEEEEEEVNQACVALEPGATGREILLHVIDDQMTEMIDIGDLQLAGRGSFTDTPHEVETTKGVQNTGQLGCNTYALSNTFAGQDCITSAAFTSG
eukprot:scaffold258566_cov19-Tisochrysis_lutea.AAC.2